MPFQSICWRVMLLLGLAWNAPLPVRAAEAFPAGLQLHWKTNDLALSSVRVEGLSTEVLASLTSLAGATGAEAAGAAARELLAVFVEQPGVLGRADLPPLAGRHQLVPGGLEFVPAFPFAPGLSYRAEYRAQPGGPLLRSVVRIAAARAARAATSVRQIYPSARRLPENLLKFYLHFTGPMSGGNIYDHIQLLNESGEPVELPFLEIDEELWNRDMTRLTLFLDPGRIKRGVRPLEEVGPSLQEGRSYTLVIRSSWRDAHGQNLARDFRKDFQAGPPERDPIDPGRWPLEVPAAGTRAPLRIRFSKALDHALALRLIQVHRPAGTALPGEASLQDEELEWSFAPATPWAAGTYEIQMPTTIEDLAGNNIGKSFEVDLFDEVARTPAPEIARRAFEVR